LLKLLLLELVFAPVALLLPNPVLDVPISKRCATLLKISLSAALCVKTPWCAVSSRYYDSNYY
jgi:hypothetical protein